MREPNCGITFGLAVSMLLNHFAQRLSEEVLNAPDSSSISWARDSILEYRGLVLE